MTTVILCVCSVLLMVTVSLLLVSVILLLRELMRSVRPQQQQSTQTGEDNDKCGVHYLDDSHEGRIAERLREQQ